MLSIVGVSSLKGAQHHFNENRYRLLSSSVSIVRAAGRGEIYAVMDGVGGRPPGRRAAQHIADRLTDFYRLPAPDSSRETLREILTAVNREVFSWELIEGSERPLGAASVTTVWLTPNREAVIFHVGTTPALHCSGKNVDQLTRSPRELRVKLAFYCSAFADDFERRSKWCEARQYREPSHRKGLDQRAEERRKDQHPDDPTQSLEDPPARNRTDDKR